MFSSKSAPQHTAAKPVLPKAYLRRSLVFMRKTQVGLLGAAQFLKKALWNAGIHKYSRPSWKSWRIGRSNIHDISS